MKPVISELIRSMPVLRIIICLSAGIAWGLNNPPKEEWILVLMCSPVLFLLVIISYYRLFYKITFSWIRGIIISLFFLIAGFTLTNSGRTIPPEPTGSFWYAELYDYPVEKANSYRLKLKLLSSADSGSFMFRNAFIYAYMNKNEHVTNMDPGDKIFFRAFLKHHKYNGNPGEFDYRTWLIRKRIYFSCYINEGEWTSWQEKNIPVRFYPLIIRKRIRDKIENIDGGKDEKEVLSAVCLGMKEQLGRDVKEKYADAGAIHVMAVSGLHVGMIWMFLSKILFFLKQKKGKVFKFLLITGILWFYAVMTGLSPSVTRSCLMFSLMGLGNVIKRNTNIYNTVLIAAFIQMLIKPEVIYEAGFRFSYAALLGILLFFKRISNLIRIAVPFIRSLTDLIAVSISAQIFTFPLAIVYFNQFPVWFIISNLIVIPLVTVIMVFFVISLLLFPVNSILIFFLDICLRLTKLMNHAVNAIDSLPFSVIEGLQLLPVQLVIIILIPLFLLYFLEYKKYGSLFIVLLLFVFFMMTGIGNYYHCLNHAEFIVYNIPYYSVMGFRSGKKHLIYISSEDENIKSEIQRASSGYWTRKHYPPPEYIHSFLNVPEEMKELTISVLPGKDNYILQYFDFKAVIISDARIFDEYRTKEKLFADIFIMNDSYYNRRGKATRNFFEVDLFLISSSVRTVINPLQACGQFCPHVHDIRTGGAYIHCFKNPGAKKKIKDLGN